MGRPNFNPLRDLFSGVIMAATSVPQLIAYAETTGYAGYRGLQTAGAPLFAWGLTTGSPFLSSGVTSITALMCKSDLDGEGYLAEYGEKEYVKLVAAYSLYVGVASIFLAVAGFGKLAKQVPQPVRTGFKWGCSVGVLLSAFPNGLFLRGSKELKQLALSSEIVAKVTEYKSSFPGAVAVSNLFYSIAHPWEWNLEATILFVLGTAFIMKAKSFLPSFLPPGTEVILVTALATLYSIHFDYQGSIVGEIPQLDPDAGIPLFGGSLRLPVEFLDVKSLVMDVPLAKRFGSYALLGMSATLFAAVNFLSIMGIASGFEVEDGIPWSPERELVAQGVSCGVAAAVGSAPVSGSMSRSLVSRMTGTTSQISCLVTACCWIFLQPYMSIMTPTPKAALSSVIISAVLRSVVIPKDLNKLQGLDFIIGWGTGIATTLSSPTQGFGSGLILYYSLSIFRPQARKEKMV